MLLNYQGFSGIDTCFRLSSHFPKVPRILTIVFILLHEYTHKITDKLLNAEINMHDGSHDHTENTETLFAYHFIKALYENDGNLYFNGLKNFRKYRIKITEPQLLLFAKVPKNVEKALSDILNNILNCWEI